MEYTVEKKFKTNLNSLITFIKSVSNDDEVTGLLILCEFGLREKTDITVVENFIKYSFPHMEQIIKRNEDYLESNLFTMFPKVKKENLDTIKNFIKNKVSKQDKDVIWEYILSFSKLSIRYLMKNSVRNTASFIGKNYSEEFLKNSLETLKTLI